MLKSKRFIETERTVFNEFMKVYGNPDNGLVSNIQTIGQWEAWTRHLMKKYNKTHLEIASARALDKNFK